jgi:hypothetical protein
MLEILDSKSDNSIDKNIINLNNSNPASFSLCNESSDGNLSLAELDNFIIKTNLGSHNITIEKTKWEIICQKVEHILESKIFSLIFLFIIIMNLFLEEIRLLVIPEDYDFMIELTILLLFVFFFAEMLASFIFIKNYRFSFFFFFDLVAIGGLIPEVHLLYEKLEYAYSEEVKNM